MSLPKISQPIFEFEVPSISKKVNFRPFLVKEEKILFTAQQSKSRKEIFKAIRQVLNNCCVDDSFDVDTITVTDAEYLFLQLRGVSVNNIVEINLLDDEDKKTYSFNVDVSEVNIVKPKKKVSNEIKVDKIGIVLEQPSYKLLESIDESLSNEYDILTFFLMNCIKSIYDENDTYDPKMYSDEELKEFIDGFSPKMFEKAKTFFDSTPRMEYVIKYKNSLGNEKKYSLTTLEDFFTLL